MVFVGVVVLGVEFGDEVVWYLVRETNPEIFLWGGRVLWLGVIGGGKSLVRVNISLGVPKICF